MKINVENNCSLNKLIILRNLDNVEINDGMVYFNNYHYRIGECGLGDVKELFIDGNRIVKNGKVKIECKDCLTCPFCKKVELSVYLSPHTLKREQGFYCGYLDVYSDDLSKLKRSKISAKWMIEERKSFEVVEERFKRRRQAYITSETIKECVDDINECITPHNPTDDLNEYGHRRIELESIMIYRNDYGVIVSHYGAMGDYGWSSKIRIHKKCDLDELVSKLRSIAVKYNCKFVNEL